MYIPLVLKILQKGTLFGKFSAMLELGVKLWFSKLWDKKHYQAEFHALSCLANLASNQTYLTQLF